MRIEIKRKPQYIMLRFTSLNNRVSDMAKWCKDRQCGKLVGLGRISFKTDEELTMFRLCWASNDDEWIELFERYYD